MRRVLIGTIIAIFGIAAALGVPYPVAAKPRREHHAQCARTVKSKAKQAERRTKCKKLKKITHDRKVVARHSVSPAVSAEAAVEPTPSSTPSTTSAPLESEDATGDEDATSETELVEEHEPSEEERTQEKPRQTPAEAVAQELLGVLALPEGAVEVGPVPALNRAPRKPGCTPLLDLDRFWRVPGKPRAVVVWIEAHAPAGAQGGGSGKSRGPDGVKKWIGGFTFTVKEPAMIQSEDLVFEAIAEGGGAALRADAQVVSQPARCVTAAG